VPEEASGLRQPRFWIRVFLLLDRLPAKANEPCLPTHTHTQIVLRLFWILSGTTRVSQYQKEDKTNLDLLEQEIMSGSGICWAICKSAPHTDNHANIHQSVFYRPDALPDSQPTASKQ